MKPIIRPDGVAFVVQARHAARSQALKAKHEAALAALQAAGATDTAESQHAARQVKVVAGQLQRQQELAQQKLAALRQQLDSDARLTATV